MSILQVNQIQNTSGTSALTIDGSGNVNIPGHVVQVVQTVKADTFSANSGAPTNITGLSASITPSSTSNKILVILSSQCSSSQTYNVYVGVTRNGTNIETVVHRIASDGQAIYREYPVQLCRLDSPASTSSITYQATLSSNGATAYINRPADQGGYVPSGNQSDSTLTLMEIAQ
jgi:hypothetical protein